jgi:hypothetical protein
METIYNILVTQSWSQAHTLNPIMASHGLFGVSFLFVLEFFGKLLILFAGSAIISKLLRLDKA